MDTKALRQKILDLAIRGKLVPQDPNDEPASVLLKRIRAEKQQMVKDGKLKPKDIKNDTIIFKGEDNLHYEKFPDGTVKCIQDAKRLLQLKPLQQPLLNLNINFNLLPFRLHLKQHLLYKRLHQMQGKQMHLQCLQAVQVCEEEFLQ